MTSLKSKILDYCRQHPFEFVHKGTLGKLAVVSWGYENENMGRRCRELEEAGLLRRGEDEKGRVMYQYVGLMSRTKEKEEATLFA